MAMLLLPRDEVCSPTPWRGAESSRGAQLSQPLQGLFICLGCCPREVSSLAAPTQPRSWTISSRLQLPHKPQTCCLQDQGRLSRRVLQLDIFTVTCGPPSASHTTQQQACPVASRTQTVLPIPTQSQALSVVPAASGTSGAHQGLPASPCRMHHHGLSSFNHSRNGPCWFPCGGDWLLPCCSMSCHTMPRQAMGPSRAGCRRQGTGIADGIPGSRSNGQQGLGAALKRCMVLLSSQPLALRRGLAGCLRQ